MSRGPPTRPTCEAITHEQVPPATEHHNYNPGPLHALHLLRSPQQRGARPADGQVPRVRRVLQLRRLRSGSEGFKLTPTRSNWLIADLEQTCWACPSQWEGRTADGSDLYIRYRHGHLSVDVGGETVFALDHGDALDGVMSTAKMRGLTPFLGWGANPS
jgi:hypothetical protein